MSEGQSTKVKYTGSALPGNAETVNIFSTVSAFPGKNYAAMHGRNRLEVSIKNDQTGTLKGYRSSDRGVNWVQVYPDTAVAAPASGATNFYDFLIVEFEDFKLDWLNGATPQTVFHVDAALVKGHTKAT